jgi:hypothetical protein
MFLCADYIFMDDIHWTAGIQSGTGNGDSEVQHTKLELLGQQ